MDSQPGESAAATSERRREAYATLVTSDEYVLGAEALLASLRDSGTHRERVVLVTAAVSELKRETLRALGCLVIEVEPFIPPRREGDAGAHIKAWDEVGYTKLRLWSLVEFGKLVYIDADAVVLANVDELFERDVAFAAAPDVSPPDRFNAGVMVLEPSAAVFADMWARAEAGLHSYDGGDTGFLNAYFSDWFTRPAAARLPFGYNAQRTVYWATHKQCPGYWEAIQPLKIIHYCSSPKPWEDPSRKGDLEMLWWEKYIAAKMPTLF